MLTVLGPHWASAVAPVRLLALAMPFATLHILFAPATNALGRPGINARIAGVGAVVMPLAFLVGVRGGATGWAAGVGLPVVLGYQAWTYWVFRKRLSAEPEHASVPA